jgi:UDP-N-acetyl-D-glucosamine/UDP-N-acetyl-D-galactosamine dehydrogenase
VYGTKLEVARMNAERIAVVGLGYVGLPLLFALSRAGHDVVGFDISQIRIEQLRRGKDVTGELSADELTGCALNCTADSQALHDRSLYIVTVPTPIDAARQPDLGPLRRACETIGRFMAKGALVVIESTVYPGLTEEVCAPLLARVSGLRVGVEFSVGYSPERINPGDRTHRLETIIKVVAASDSASLARLERVYGAIVPAGLHFAPSIKVAEAAKVIENTQRDLNIALMNELAIIFDRLGIRTRDVLEAARSKWNFLPFSPGLVGGHCIGVDPYYLTTKAENVGYHPDVILAGRRINDGMPAFIAQKLVKLLAGRGTALQQARVGILGLTFKENVPDLRNSRVPDLVRELGEYGIRAAVHDPLADPAEAIRQYGIRLAPLEELGDLHALVFAVPHAHYLGSLQKWLPAILRPAGILIDVKSQIDTAQLPSEVHYWSL